MGTMVRRHALGEKASVCVGMLSYHRLDRLKRAVAKLYETTELPFDLLIVDNHSDEETVAYLKELNAQKLAYVMLNEENAGWMVAMNQALGWIASEEYDYAVLLENDGYGYSVDLRYPCWLTMHIEALRVTGLPLLQGRHPLRGDPDVNADDVVRVNRFGFDLRIHDEIWSKLLVIPRRTYESVGGFFWQFDGAHGAYCDVEWGDRVLRWSEEETTLPFGVSLGESHFRYDRIAGSLYPNEEQIRELAMRDQRTRDLFLRRRRWIWDALQPGLFVPFVPPSQSLPLEQPGQPGQPGQPE